MREFADEILLSVDGAFQERRCFGEPAFTPGEFAESRLGVCQTGPIVVDFADVLDQTLEQRRGGPSSASHYQTSQASLRGVTCPQTQT